MPAKTQPFKSFKGLQNTLPTQRLGLSWLSVADNVDVHSTGMVERRDGFSLASTLPDVRFAMQSEDYSRVMLVADGAVQVMRQGGGASGLDLRRILTLSFPHAKMGAVEVNGEFFFTNGFDSGIVTQDDSVKAWAWDVPMPPTLSIVSGSMPAGLYRVCVTYVLPGGRETGPSDEAEILLWNGSGLQVTDIPQHPVYRTRLYVCMADSDVFSLSVDAAGPACTINLPPHSLGVPLPTANKLPLPMGCDVVSFWSGRIFAAHFMASDDQSVVWASDPLAFHLFDMAGGFFMVKGHVLMMASTSEALVVGTDKAIYAYSGESISQIADYGVVEGQCWARDDDTGQVMIWTKRGICSALPFKNLTQKNLSIPHGTSAGCAVLKRDGETKFIATLVKGGSSFNPKI